MRKFIIFFLSFLCFIAIFSNYNIAEASKLTEKQINQFRQMKAEHYAKINALENKILNLDLQQTGLDLSYHFAFRKVFDGRISELQKQIKEENEAFYKKVKNTFGEEIADTLKPNI